MPTYHFLLRGGARPEQDCGQVDLPDAEAAFYHAYRNAREAIGCCAEADFLCACRVEVEDEERAPVWSIPLIDFVHAAG